MIHVSRDEVDNRSLGSTDNRLYAHHSEQQDLVQPDIPYVLEYIIELHHQLGHV